MGWLLSYADIDTCSMAHCDAGGAGAIHPIRPVLVQRGTIHRYGNTDESSDQIMDVLHYHIHDDARSPSAMVKAIFLLSGDG